MKKHIYNLITSLFVGLCLFSFSCNEEDNDTPDNSLTNKKVIQFVYDCMSNVYLWSNNVPTLSIDKETNPQEYFQKIKYADDPWSFLTDNITGVNETLAGEGKSFGYSLVLGTFIDKPEEIFAVVLFTYPGTSAEKAGLKRGDIILTINGKAITATNYTDLYYASQIEIGIGYAEDRVLYPTGKSLTLTSSKMYQEPVHTYKIFERGQHKIGYLFYTDFLLNSHDALQNVFANFKNNQVTDMILDLRYNTGGYVITAQLLACLLAPYSALENKDVFLKEIWNNDYMKYFESQGYDRNTYFSTEIQYIDMNENSVKIPIRSNLNLNRLYVITASNSASASEALIIGLAPYLQLTTIGELTAGKYCEGIIFTSDMIYEKSIPDIENWGLYAMVSRYTDRDGLTKCIGGYTPNIYLPDDFFNQTPIGDENETLLAETIALITGTHTLAPSLRSDMEKINKFKPIPGAKLRANDFEGKLILNRMENGKWKMESGK